ncbi:MAG: thioredoxin family protein [Abitibacteriaceae bacterium]|nr:thioredoxin family protein [Abditibacteriaceae bacterium]
MDSNTYTNQAVINEAQNFISVKVNADTQLPLSEQYRIEAVPTIVWLDSSGNERKRDVGGYSPADFVTEMQAAH